MSESWDDYAENWDDNESVISYSQKAYNSLLNIVDINGLSVLDFGCGTGLLTEKISKKAKCIVALDSSEKMISVLNSKGLKNVATIKNELTQSLIDTDSNLSEGFDLIVASSALAFVTDYHETLRLLKTLLRSGGVLVQWDWFKDNDTSGAGFEKAMIETEMRKVGFSECLTTIPFEMANSDGAMKVIMGIGKNT